MTTTRLRPATPADYARLVDIWRSAVDATHDFLSAEHRDQIQSNLAPAYFPHVTLVVAEQDGEPVGFAGTAEDSLEMLFVHDDARGTGIGGTLLRHVIEEAGVLRVDVNEQNPQAVGFYEHSGFTVAGRDEVDGQGWPYPTLHLTLANND